MEAKVQMKRTALGRNGFIGELYDVRTESLSSRSLFRSSLPPGFVQRRDISRTESEYKFTESISERFDLLNVQGELQVSVLCGLIELNGSGKYFTEEKISGKSVSCTLVCKFETVSEKLVASFDEILAHVDLEVLQDPQFTHVIVEENWGANCLLTLEAVYGSDSEKKEIEGELKAAASGLGKLCSASGGGNLSKEERALGSRSDVRIKVWADVLPEKELPSSIEAFRDFVQEISGLLQKTNQGKGKPLNYAMIPLDWMRKAAKVECSAEVVVRSIDESFLLSIVCLFEEIAEVRQRLCCLVETMKNAEKYVKREELRDARRELEKLRVKESKLKLMIATDWVAVKSGKKSLRDLVRQIEKFKFQELNLLSHEDYLESASSVCRKLSAIEHYASLGVAYLGREETFSDFVVRNASSELVVLVTSSDLNAGEPETATKTSSYFAKLVEERMPQTKYAVFDLGFWEEANQFLGVSVTGPRVFHLKGTEILSSDLLGEYLKEKESNFVRPKQGTEFEIGRSKPGNRIPLEMACPGFRAGSCGPEKLEWLCLRCKNVAEFGFDDHFYCLCGRGVSAEFDFRCKNPKHGDSFLPSEEEFLKEELSTLRPFKELNILILGQSGVGKSTWINSINNYLSYSDLREAKEGGVLCQIPASFPIYDSKTMKKHVIDVGIKSDGEETETGKSATQYCHTYSLLWGERYVRLIDTPGLGDVRGIEQDKKNMEMIVNFIGHLKELHGVCILIKANDNRFHAIFTYCIKELLSHMHKSVARNIVFCFTNSRNTFYMPGQSSALLEVLLNKLDVKGEIVLGRHNMFCLDNEAFLFLCTLKYPEIQHDDILVASFAQSWEISRRETLRMFTEMKNLRPHRLEETLSLVTSRSRIFSLTKPIAEISKTIQVNLSAIERKRNEIHNSKQNIEELSKKLKINIIRLKSDTLPWPRTVCTSPSCVEYYQYKDVDIKEVEYKTHCHFRCYLEDIEEKTTGNAKLKDCSAMEAGRCKVCGCRWESHMHIKYSQKRVEEEVVDKRVMGDMEKEQSEKKTIEELVQTLENITEKYKREQEFIIQTSVKFGMFLKSNAISVYNDSLADYLNHLIKQEQDKPYKSKTEEQLLENLINMLRHYEAEVAVLQEVINNSGPDADPLTPQEVLDLENQLYRLELTGADIRNSVDANRTSTSRAFEYTETPLGYSVKHKNTKLQKVKAWAKSLISG